VFANVKKKKKKKMTECFWCNQTFDNTDHDACPNCASNVHTREIKIIEENKMDEEQELCEYCGDTVDDCINAEECNEGVGRQRPDDDDLYEAYKEQKADEYFDSQE
jgi:rRNA maturation endonuclease Nob1